MTHRKKTWNDEANRARAFALLSLALLLNACATSETPAARDEPFTPLDAIEVSVTAPNGDPISGATVWIDGSADGVVVKLANKAQIVDEQGDTCEEAPSTASVVDCTDSEGVAVLSCDGLSGSVDVSFAKGSFAGVIQGDCTAPKPIDASFDAEVTSIAVVTGTFDAIEDVLGKLGFGEIDAAGHLQAGTELFTLYDGDASLGPEYGDFEDVLLNPAQLANHDIIFINCDEFGLGIELSVDTQAKAANLREYVENGGKLYVTDLSYDYVEQAFPEFVDFFGSGSGSTPETPGAAELGLTFSDPNSIVNDPGLGDWLDAVDVNFGNTDTHCLNTSPNAITGARNADGSIHIGDLLGGWAMIDGVEADAPAEVTEWVVGTDLEGASLRPLTVTFDVGLGRVLFTSYHTAGTCPSTGFWPQERILEFLVFAL
jgi:hypothetical protein